MENAGFRWALRTFPFDSAEFQGGNGDGRALEAKAATHTVFLPPSFTQPISSESFNFTGNDGHYPFITVYKGSNDSNGRVIRLLFLAAIIHSHPGAIWSFQSR